MTLTIEQIKELIGPAVDQAVERAVKAQAQQGGTARLAGLTGNWDRGPEPTKTLLDRGQGLGAGRLVRALAAGKGDPLRAAHTVRASWGEDGEDVAKALESNIDAAGGFVVPPGYVAEIIELLYPATVVRGSGVRTMPMDNGTLEIPRLANGVQSEYVGENQNITVDQPDFGMLNLAWKKLACIVPISNDLLRFSNPSVDGIVRDDLVMSMALREDRAFIRDDGTGQKPRGLRFQSGITVRAATALPAGDVDRIRTIRADLGRLELALEDNNVPLVGAGYLMRPGVRTFLSNLTDANGNQPFRAELQGGTLNGYPVRFTTQIPGNLGAGTNETEVYFVAFPQAIIAEASTMLLDSSSEAAYHDGTAVQATFSRDQTVVRAIARHDFGLRHPLAVAVLTGVTYHTLAA